MGPGSKGSLSRDEVIDALRVLSEDEEAIIDEVDTLFDLVDLDGQHSLTHTLEHTIVRTDMHEHALLIRESRTQFDLIDL